MSRAKHVSNNGSFLSESVERSRAFNKSVNTLSSQLHERTIQLAWLLDIRRDEWRDDPMAILRQDASMWALGVSFQLIGPLQNLADKRTIGNHLRSPVLSSEARRQNIICRGVGLVKAEAGRNPGHARHAICH